MIVNGEEEDDEEEGEEEGEFADFYPTSAAAGPDFEDLKAAPPSKPNVTQVG